MPLVFAAIVCAALASNFVLLAAIAAGRLRKGWGQRFLLAVEIAFFAVVTVAVVGAGLAVADSLGWQVTRRDLRVGLVGALALALAAALGGILTYLEYSVVGRRRAFGEDLRRSLWFGRSGVRRWDGESR
jgi:hypothetical protein